MTLVERWRRGARLAMNENSPWGGSGGSNGGSGGGRDSGNGPRNPWSRPPGDEPPGRDPRGPTAVEELLRRARSTIGDGLPGGPSGRAIWLYVLLGVIAIWLVTTCSHSIGSQERGIVTFLGRYSRTLKPGFNVTLPAPFESVKTIDVEEIRTVDLGGSGDSGRLTLTRDQNIVDLSYAVRWSVGNPEYYAFQLADPDATVRDAAQSAMRAVIADATLSTVLGGGKADIEEQVRARTQQMLDGYRAGIRVQGVTIKQADAPDAVNDAVKDVTAAQQAAQTYITEARTYGQQVTAQAQSEAAAFDKVYAQYKLAPEVTRKRMYYDTMEKVLSGVDKTIVEAPGVTPYLPLPEVTRRPPARADGESQ